jgi:hypothetical protein
MPSKTAKQARTMAAAAHNPAFAKKVGIPVSVAKEFNQADKGKKFMKGGMMKHSDIAKDKPMMKKVAAEAVKGHEKRMHKMAKGGVTRADGCVTKGHTKGKMIAMRMGGKTCG